MSFPLDAGRRWFGTLTCSATASRSWHRLALTFVILLLHSSFVIPALQAHPSDISYLQAKIERHRIDLRFTFNLLTLTRFVAIDADQDQRITRAELEAAEPALRKYLDSHIQVRINDEAATLGTAAGLECVWPTAAGQQQPEAPESDYAQRYVDLVFRQNLKPILADIWLGFDIWQETGPLGTIETTYEQDELRMQVPFSMSEPDYLYDTGFAVEDIFQAPTPATTAASPLQGVHGPRTWIVWAGVACLGLAIAAAVRIRRTRRRCRAKNDGSGFQPSRSDS